MQMGTGTCWWIYVGEVANATANGLCVMMMMVVLIAQSLTTNTIIDAIGVQGMFYILGGSQFIFIFILHFAMKESKGMSIEERA